jgi:hypothetical protein
MKKQMEQAAKQMGPMGGMMDMFDEAMLLEPLNMAIDMMVESADILIEDNKMYPNGKPKEVEVENLGAHGKDPNTPQLEIEVEEGKNAEFSLSDNKG